MGFNSVIQQLRALDLPAKAKADLALLWRHASRLVERILAFLATHRHLTECLVLGAIGLALASQIPVIGSLLGIAALITAGSIGVYCELREDLTRAFAGEAA